MTRKEREKNYNISNKLAYTLIVIALIIGLGVGVIAYGTGSPSTMGHTTNEITWPACSAGQVLGVSGGNVVCVDLPSSPSLTKGIEIYRCPTTPTASNYCASVQLTRNGIGPCIGQLATQPSGCFTVDANCAYTGFGTCVLVGYLIA